MESCILCEMYQIICLEISILSKFTMTIFDEGTHPSTIKTLQGF